MSEPSRITANGIDFAYLEAGPADGPLALCLHGFPDHAPTWSHLMPLLADAGYHVVAPWMRGYSPTGLAPDGNYQVASLALDALALADELAGDRDAVLIGHDWGAITAYTAVGHRPERFSKLVTLAVPHSSGLMSTFLTPAQLQASFYVFFFQTPLADGVVPANDFEFIDHLWSYWSPGHPESAEYMRALKDTLGAPGSTSAAIDYYRFMLGTLPGDPALDAVAAAATAPIQVPTLYLHGIDCGCMLVRSANEELMRPFFPAGLDLRLIPDAGHFLHRDRPDAVNGPILEFLAR
ncbi:MAG: alpha/beta fold hydrolase [Acidimicrobiia bacterium]